MPLEATAIKTEPTEAEIEAEVNRLAEMTMTGYALARKPAADAFGIGVGLLDSLVTGRRKVTKGAVESPFKDIEPLPDAVDGDGMFTAIHTALRRHVILDDADAVAVTFWIVHCFMFDAFRTSPRLAITSATMRCGKTRLLDFIAALVPRVLRAASISEAVLFRAVEAYRPIVLYDEADRSLDEKAKPELIGLINAGHSPGTFAWRVEGDGDNRRLAHYAVHSPLALAAIGKLAGTIRDRSIITSMRRKRPNESVARLDREATAALGQLARGCARWAQDNIEAARHARPGIPKELDDRAADNAEPLLILADLASHEWPFRVRKALVEINGKRIEDEDDMGVRLLHDIKRVFDDTGDAEIGATELVKGLTDPEDSLWKEMGRAGKPITPAKLSRMLARFGVGPERIQTGGGRVRGYVLTRFEDAFSRYPSSQSVQVSQTQQNQAILQFPKCPDGGSLDTLKSGEKLDEIGIRDTWTLSKPESGGKEGIEAEADLDDRAADEAEREDRQ